MSLKNTYIFLAFYTIRTEIKGKCIFPGFYFTTAFDSFLLVESRVGTFS